MHFNPGFGILVLWLRVAAALEVKDIHVPKGSLKVREGERLLIPCSFKTDENVRLSNLRVEWGIIQANNKTYRPIYRVADAMLEGLPEPNPYEGRAQMFISLIPSGNCSLVLQGMTGSDSGEYQVRFYADGQVTMSQTVAVNVKTEGRNGRSDSLMSLIGYSNNKKKLLGHTTNEKKLLGHTTNEKELIGHTNNEKELIGDTNNEKEVIGDTNNEKELIGYTNNKKKPEANADHNCSEFAEFDKHLISLTKGISTISTRTGVSILGLEIIAGAITAILLMGSMVGVILCCHFYSGMRNLEKQKTQMEKQVTFKSGPDEYYCSITDQQYLQEQQRVREQQSEQRKKCLERCQEEHLKRCQQETEDEEEDKEVQTETSECSSSLTSPLCHYRYVLISDSDTSVCSFQ
eukprot:gi/632978672/ref/XP_007906044.1/ PREDICTED: uncharacterized protein LOC103188037 [Callorhinchus milii]